MDTQEHGRTAGLAGLSTLELADLSSTAAATSTCRSLDVRASFLLLFSTPPLHQFCYAYSWRKDHGVRRSRRLIVMGHGETMTTHGGSFTCLDQFMCTVLVCHCLRRKVH